MASKLYVGNLPYEVSDEALQQFFSNAGFRIESAKVIRDMNTGRSRGFGFVELAAGEDMAQAISKLNGQTLEGKVLQINEARPQAPRGDRGGRGGYGGRRRY
jgi:RNA recognition motif-containing protein